MAAILYLLALLVNLPTDAAQVAADAGATCERGCIVGADGWVYQITREDLVWTARMAHCEIETVLTTDDAPATMWSLATNFYRRHLAGRVETWSYFVSHYSGCTSPLWATGGRYYSPRVTPIADVNRRLRWRSIPQRTRDFVRSFFRAEMPNRWPGWCWVWTRGWEYRAHPTHLGPYYAVEDRGQSLNAYYVDPQTRDFLPWTVQIVAARGER